MNLSVSLSNNMSVSMILSSSAQSKWIYEYEYEYESPVIGLLFHVMIFALFWLGHYGFGRDTVDSRESRMWQHRRTTE